MKNLSMPGLDISRMTIKMHKLIFNNPKSILIKKKIHDQCDLVRGGKTHVDKLLGEWY